MKHYSSYVTLTIPTGTEIARASNHERTTTTWPRTVRARLNVTRRNAPQPDAAWFFTEGAYEYYVSLSAPGLLAVDERFTVGAR